MKTLMTLFAVVCTVVLGACSSNKVVQKPDCKTVCKAVCK